MRKLNVVLAPESAAHRAVAPPAPPPSGEAPSANLAPGFEPQPAWNMTAGGGSTIADLVFVNRYVGTAGAWAQTDVENIDRALGAALGDTALQSVIAQYYPGPISSTMLPSALRETALSATVYKDAVEQLAVQLHAEGVLGEADPASSVINIMLPEGIALSDELTPGAEAPAGAQEAWERRRAGTIKIDPDNAADSGHGLGGYHGSVHLEAGVEVYYAVGVYSEGANGIAAFDEPWKNVVATFYHELNEARTDPGVEDVNATGNGNLLGWYSQEGQGEIGDLPINACGGDLGLVFQEVALADGTGTVPIQLMWSNLAGGPAASA
ncbi:MAG TPA: hypothetical protein VID29_05270 [Solirubrobacteraceae bacterium]